MVPDERPTFGSLFAGIGGIDLGLERAGWDCRFQVEWDAYCQRVLAKHWPDVPRYGDIHDVHGPLAHAKSIGGQPLAGGVSEDDRWARPEGGVVPVGGCANCLPPVDLLAGGFPCQPFSNAGQRRGVDDDRWLWPEFARCIRELRPRYVLVENVPGLLAGHGGMGHVLGDLAALGYDTEWESIPAASVGAPHLRYRVWIIGTQQPRVLADACSGWRQDDGLRAGWDEPRERSTLAHAQGDSGRVSDRNGAPDVPDPDIIGRQSERSGGLLHGLGSALGNDTDGCGSSVADTPSLRPQGPREHVESVDQTPSRDRQAGEPRDGGWWATEPDVGRVAHGVPARVDRLRALGNAVVPQVVEFIGRRILEAEGLT